MPTRQQPLKSNRHEPTTDLMEVLHLRRMRTTAKLQQQLDDFEQLNEAEQRELMLRRLLDLEASVASLTNEMFKLYTDLTTHLKLHAREHRAARDRLGDC